MQNSQRLVYDAKRVPLLYVEYSNFAWGEVHRKLWVEAKGRVHVSRQEKSGYVLKEVAPIPEREWMNEWLPLIEQATRALTSDKGVWQKTGFAMDAGTATFWLGAKRVKLASEGDESGQLMHHDPAVQALITRLTKLYSSTRL